MNAKSLRHTRNYDVPRKKENMKTARKMSLCKEWRIFTRIANDLDIKQLFKTINLGKKRYSNSVFTLV